MNSGASKYAQSVDNVFIFIVVISVLILLGVTVAMIYFVIRYNRKRNPVGAHIEGNFLLEVIWIAIPTILVLTMFYYGFTSFSKLRNVPKDAMVVKVTGQMWKWSFQYANGKRYDTLYVPLGKAIKLELTSLDVTHSFYVPAFRVKEDAVPGRTGYMVLQPERTGVFQVECAEYCGLHHAYMLNKVIVLPENEFSAWLNSGIDSTSTTMASRAGDRKDSTTVKNK